MTDKQIELYQEDFYAFVNSEGFKAFYKEVVTDRLSVPQERLSLEELARLRVEQSGAFKVLNMIESYSKSTQPVFDPFQAAVLEDEAQTDDSLAMLAQES